LRSFPFDKVRIDRSFVHGIGLQREGDAIVRALASLCDKLGIMTAAEGVDNEMQFEILSAEECTEVQGGLFGGLMPTSDIPTFCEAMSKAADRAHVAAGNPSQVLANPL
jgi:EAL domain-containing protein (putative c-di-GMP-specific phosphodiesterase class I)